MRETLHLSVAKEKAAAIPTPASRRPPPTSHQSLDPAPAFAAAAPRFRDGSFGKDLPGVFSKTRRRFAGERSSLGR